jgi:dolichyl-phosphate beta-glucosyltransferase
VFVLAPQSRRIHAPSDMRCLLVIPAFRESERLPPFLRELLATVRCDVLVVDDGSGPPHAGRVRDLAASLACANLLPPVCLGRNLGKGGAIRAGWEKCAGYDWLGFVDADGAVSPAEVRRVLELAAGADSVDALFGSRVKMLGRRIERSAVRHCIGRIFASIVAATITPEVYDSQCGLKFIRTAAYDRIAPMLREDGFAFDVELLAALLDSGARVVEVPIDWSDQPGSKVSLLGDSLRMLRAVRRIQRQRANWRW